MATDPHRDPVMADAAAHLNDERPPQAHDMTIKLRPRTGSRWVHKSRSAKGTVVLASADDSREFVVIRYDMAPDDARFGLHDFMQCHEPDLAPFQATMEAAQSRLNAAEQRKQLTEAVEAYREAIEEEVSRRRLHQRAATRAGWARDALDELIKAVGA